MLVVPITHLSFLIMHRLTTLLISVTPHFTKVRNKFQSEIQKFGDLHRRSVGKDDFSHAFFLSFGAIKVVFVAADVDPLNPDAISDMLPTSFELSPTTHTAPIAGPSIPWGRHTPETYSIAHAQTVLNEDHHGLNHVSRILKFLAVGKLRGAVQGIIYVVRPPAVGKTSIGKTEIKENRRTYVGLIRALKRLETENPLVLNDEVDKIGRRINGDPAGDPTTLTFIPAPLLDRMEVLKVPGYVSEQKLIIASRYLGPQVKEASGLAEADVEVESSTVDILLKYYCREIGVQNLMKHIEKQPYHKEMTKRSAPSYSKTKTRIAMSSQTSTLVHEVGVFAQITSVFAVAGAWRRRRRQRGWFNCCLVSILEQKYPNLSSFKAGPAKITEDQPQTVEPPTTPLLLRLHNLNFTLPHVFLQESRNPW
ncbi:hypothetical protein BYT27DRAFT_7337766 [Phlegmacium glaucopus]|nr:hypothetical protein BYT27DRAFT_7337766 [Phlegmacium glaucopus]